MPGTSLTPDDAGALFALMPHAVCVLDADGRILHVNPAWRTTLGVRLPKPGRSSFLDAVCASDVEPLAAALERCRAGGTPDPVVVECARKRESPVPIEWRFAPSSDGRIVAWGRDVSRERRRMEAVGELRMLEDEAERCAGLGSWRLSLIDGGLAWSPEMYRIYGVDPSAGADLIATARAAVHPDDRAMFDEIGRSVASDGVLRSSEYRIVLPDHTVKYVQVEGRQVADAAGRAVALVGFVQDVTERRQAQDALRRSQEQLRMLFDLATEAIFVADAEHRYVDVNAYACEMLGYSREELLAMSMGDLSAPDDVAAQPIRWSALDTDAGIFSVRRFVRKDGSVLTVEVSSREMPDGRFLGMVRDVTDRKRVEETLAESEARYHLLVEEAPAAVFVQQDGLFAYLNPAAVRLFGSTGPDDLIGTPVPDRIHPDYRETVREKIAGLADMVAGPPREQQYLQLDGSPVDVEVRATPIHYGGRLACQVIAQDITERKAVEKALRASEEKYRNLFNNAEVGMFRTRLDGSEMLDLNDSYLETLGYDRDEIVGKPSVMHWADPAERDAMVRTLMTEGRVTDMECRLLRKNGEVIHCITSVRLYPEEGTLEGSILNISARKRAEQALAESEENLRDAQEIARVGSYVYDIASDVWTSSETMDDIFGIDASYVRDFAGWLALVHEDDREMMSRYFSGEVVGQGYPFDKEYRVTRHADGATLWAHGYGRLEVGADGAPVRMIGAIQDVSVRHEMEAALKHTNRSLERMVYDVAEAMGRVVEIRDQYTKGHQERTSRLAKAIAIEMGLPGHDVAAVEMAAVVHDIGKLSVPAEILSRPTKLSELEMSLVREHPRNGFEILKDIPFPWPVAEIVLQHHERLDGSGYPLGLRGDEIVPLAQVLVVADVVEAMATHRPYRPALGVPAAINEIRQCPEKYGAAAVEACCRLYERGELDL